MLSRSAIIEHVRSLEVIRVVRDVSEEVGDRPFLYGASLRDVALEQPPRRFDFFVVGSAERLTRKLQEKASGLVWRVELDDGVLFRHHQDNLEELGFVEFPGCSFEQNLERCLDFTVNSFVFDVGTNELFDVGGAFSDLTNGTIRVVSAGVFDTSPRSAARLFRAVRLALLDPRFTIAEDTASEIVAHGQLIGTVHGRFLGNEWQLILESNEYSRGLRLLDELGLLEPFVARFLTTELVSGPRLVNELMKKLHSLDSLLGCLDERFPERLRGHVPLMRHVLVTARGMDRKLPASPLSARRAFVRRAGHRIETFLHALGLSPETAFRVRVVATGYLLGVASMIYDGSDLRSIAENSIREFGSWKGFLASVLVWSHGIMDNGRRDASLDLDESLFQFPVHAVSNNLRDPGTP